MVYYDETIESTPTPTPIDTDCPQDPIYYLQDYPCFCPSRSKEKAKEWWDQAIEFFICDYFKNNYGYYGVKNISHTPGDDKALTTPRWFFGGVDYQFEDSIVGEVKFVYETTTFDAITDNENEERNTITKTINWNDDNEYIDNFFNMIYHFCKGF